MLLYLFSLLLYRFPIEKAVSNYLMLPELNSNQYLDLLSQMYSSLHCLFQFRLGKLFIGNIKNVGRIPFNFIRLFLFILP